MEMTLNKRTSPEQTPNTGAKDILARLMASENIIVEHSAAAQTASFNTKTRVLILPMWDHMDDAMYDMLVGHEVAHALWTPMDEWSDCMDRFGAINRGLFQTFVNIVEDARIERMIKAKFPGIRRDFYAAYKDLAERDLFEIGDRDITELPVIDRLNLHFKIGPFMNVPFTASEDEAGVVESLENTKTFADVVEVAANLFQQHLDEQPEEESPETGDTPETGEGESDGPSGNQGMPSEGGQDAPEEGTGNGIGGDSDAEDGEGESGKSDDGEDSGESMDDDTDTGEGAESKSKATSGSEDSESTDATPEELEDNTSYSSETQRGAGATQNAMDRAVADMADSFAREREYYTIPSVNLDKIIVDYKEVHKDIAASIRKRSSNFDEQWGTASMLMGQFERDSKKTINMMAQQFMRKQSADEQHRTSVSKTGLLDMNTLHSYKWNEDVFLRNEEIADGKNHGLVLFVDWSGSMCDIMEDTIKQMIQMVLFCKKVGIPFDVYSFTSQRKLPEGVISYYDMDDEQRAEFDKDRNQFGDCTWLNEFCLNNYLSSRMSAREMKTALVHMMWLARSMDYYSGFVCPDSHNLGSTPLNEAIASALEIVPAFQKRNKVQIVNTMFLTDGEASSRLGYYGADAFLRDDQTKRSYDCSRRGESGGTTGALLNALTDRTGANNVGIYLNNANKLRGYYEDEQIAQYKKEGFASTTKAGYTEYFIVKANKQVENDLMDNVGSDASFTRIKNAFMKSSASRVNSRVLLNRVIDLIS